MRSLNAAALAMVEASWPEGRWYALGEVPAKPTTPYLVLSVTSGAPGGYTLDISQGFKAHRLVVQAVGRTDAEVGFAVERADAAFEDRSLTVDGFDCGPMAGDERVAATVLRDPDGGGLLSCTVLYPFTATPTA